MRQMVFSINSEHAKISEVFPGFFISGVCALTPAIIADNKINVIINTTEEVPNVKSLGEVEYVKLGLKDTPETNISSHFDHLSDEIEEMIKAGKNVLIHSVQGVSRCAALCLAYMIKAQKKSLKESYDFLKSKRAMVKINEGFWRQLIDFEQEVKKSNEVCLKVSTSSIAISSDAQVVGDGISDEGVNGCRQLRPRNQNLFRSGISRPECLQSDTLAAFAKVFYLEIARRTKCRRKIGPIFQPVLETLYEQTEILV